MPATSFYIATRLERADDHRLVSSTLSRVFGWTCTYDWTVHGSVQRDGPDRIAEVARAEMEGVCMADVVIVLLPGGRGTHTELGLALAWNKPVFIQADPAAGFFADDERTCAFYHAPTVRRVDSLTDLLAALQAWEVGP